MSRNTLLSTTSISSHVNKIITHHESERDYTHKSRFQFGDIFFFIILIFNHTKVDFDVSSQLIYQLNQSQSGIAVTVTMVNVYVEGHGGSNSPLMVLNAHSSYCSHSKLHLYTYNKRLSDI